MKPTHTTPPSGTGILRAADDAREHAGGGAAGPRQPRLGLVLSAGGARGLAHVGVIQVLEENGIPVTAIAGTSMGAYVGAV